MKHIQSAVFHFIILTDNISLHVESIPYTPQKTTFIAQAFQEEGEAITTNWHDYGDEDIICVMNL